MVDRGEINLGVVETLVAMSQADHMANAGTRDSTLLGGLNNVYGPVLYDIGKETMIRGITIL